MMQAATVISPVKAPALSFPREGSAPLTPTKTDAANEKQDEGPSSPATASSSGGESCSSPARRRGFGKTFALPKHPKLLRRATTSVDGGKTTTHHHHHHHHQHMRRLSSGPDPFDSISSSFSSDNASSSILTTPPPLNLSEWAEPPATTFKIRGQSYMSDNVKIHSDESLFRLLTVDLIRSDKPIMGGLCSHPNERIQLALAREAASGGNKQELPDFIFAINIAVPGPPYYHLVTYYAVDDLDLLTDPTTPFGTLAANFFFGESDEFRHDTFKLIPRIAEGNFVVKKAVGSKPAILGRKLKQSYIRTDRFFELIIDVGSDKVAERVVKLSIGYAKTLIVDMAFVLEGNDESTLPEQIMGCVRLKNIDFKKKNGLRHCEVPSTRSS